MYKRKTKDEFQVQGLYGFSWKRVACEDTLEEAKQRLREYGENETDTCFKIVKVKVKL